MSTFMANPDKIDRKWYVVDAEGHTLGRLASQVASVLRGKNKAVFTPHIDCSALAASVLLSSWLTAASPCP